jgi:hypothetical protein
MLRCWTPVVQPAYAPGLTAADFDRLAERLNGLPVLYGHNGDSLVCGHAEYGMHVKDAQDPRANGVWACLALRDELTPEVPDAFGVCGLVAIGLLSCSSVTTQLLNPSSDHLQSHELSLLPPSENRQPGTHLFRYSNEPDFYNHLERFAYRNPYIDPLGARDPPLDGDDLKILLNALPNLFPPGKAPRSGLGIHGDGGAKNVGALYMQGCRTRATDAMVAKFSAPAVTSNTLADAGATYATDGWWLPNTTLRDGRAAYLGKKPLSAVTYQFIGCTADGLPLYAAPM